MSSIFFVVPVHQRHELTRLCLEQLRWTCDELELKYIRANAVIVGNEPEHREVAKANGFWWVHQDNEPLARKFNDGIEAAYWAGADYVVPCGSDNWVHPDWFTRLPEPDEVICHRQCVVVSSDGSELAYLNISYDGGDGIRIFPIKLFAKLDYRPAADYRNRAIDTSIVERLRRFAGWTPKWVYHEWDPAEVVGFQSDDFDIQLNDYDGLVKAFGVGVNNMPWHRLAEAYPKEAVTRMEAYFARRLRIADGVFV